MDALRFLSWLTAITGLYASDGCKTMEFPDNLALQGQALSGFVFKTIKASEEKLCRHKCFMDTSDRCLSYNYLTNDLTCELSESDHVIHPENLVTRSGSIYRAAKNSCACSKHQVCRYNFVDSSHSCECHANFTGSLCNQASSSTSLGTSVQSSTTNIQATPTTISNTVSSTTTTHTNTNTQTTNTPTTNNNLQTTTSTTTTTHTTNTQTTNNNLQTSTSTTTTQPTNTPTTNNNHQTITPSTTNQLQTKALTTTTNLQPTSTSSTTSATANVAPSTSANHQTASSQTITVDSTTAANTVNACSTNPCLNNGNCTTTPSGNFSCTCALGYTGSTCDKAFRDCSKYKTANSALQSGEYTIQPDANSSAFTVYCDMTSKGGGWTVFQRRVSNTVSFKREWGNYKGGFGVLAGNFWLGNEKLHKITQSFYATLRIDVTDYSSNSVYSEHTVFKVGNETSKYLLTIEGLYAGTDGNAMSAHKGMEFTTFDSDNDESTVSNCALMHVGGFWYKNCIENGASPNGVYTGNSAADPRGITWKSWKKSLENVKSVQMMLRPTNYDCALKTTTNRCCHIPFEYSGTVYYACTNAGTGRYDYLWCSYQYTYGLDEDTYWGRC